MEKFQKISGKAIISFLVSLALCSLCVSVMITHRANIQKSQMVQTIVLPEEIALITAGLLISLFVFFIMQQNSELRQMRINLNNKVTTDPLTGIYNRRYLDENINNLLKSISRSNSVLTLIMIDVDFLKKYNDAYGFTKGDSCLNIVARVIAQSIKRADDFIARYGGEEFIAVLPCTDKNGAQIIADRVINNIRNCKIPHEQSEIEKFVTVSIGVTTGHADHSGTSGDAFIKRAEEAMHLSKKNGRNRFTFLDFANP